MRSFLYAAAVLTLLSAGALNVASPSARAGIFEAAKAFLLKNRPLWEAAGKTLCGRATPGVK